MFKQNNGHFQGGLFNGYTQIDEKIQKRLKNSWSPLFYEHVFCQIDETPFAVLYSEDTGRPNFPVNILLSLEFFKHLKDFTDEELIEQFYFNYQIIYALGLRNLGEMYLAPRTLYEFRSRLYGYTLEHPDQENLIFEQFEQLTSTFLEKAKLDTSEQRTDSTQIMSNIKRAGRLAVAFDVLEQAIQACPSNLLSNRLQGVLESTFKANLLYRSKGGEAEKRLDEIFGLCAELLDMTQDDPDLHALPALILVRRLLAEQAVLVDGLWKAKPNKDVAANSLQSAYDPDATYRSKGKKGYVGYVANITETCADENPVQIITDYTVKKNSVSDTEMLEERLQQIKEKTKLTDLYADGGYYGEDVEKQATKSTVNIHYTDMTGKDPSVKKLPLTSFTIENDKITSCSAEKLALRTTFKKKTGILTAHFSLEECQACPQRDVCPVKFQKKSSTLRISQKALLAARKRQMIHAERKETTSKRAAIEGTNSVLKRRHGADKLRVRTQVRVDVAFGLKVISYNIRQILRFFKGSVRRKPKQGVSAFVC